MEDHIKQYWEKQGASYKDSHWASWGDRYMIELEIETISGYLKQDGYVLDVGCANGYSTYKQLEKHNLKSIVGVDYAASMIEQANLVRNKAVEKATFEVGDIRNLSFKDNTFDVVYTTRVLINLATWQEQKQGLRECLRVVKPGGLVLISEAFWEPLVTLNALRQVLHCAPLVEHDFNRYLKKANLDQYLKELGVSFEVNEFSSLYYVGSRLLRDLISDQKVSGYENDFNKLFFELEKKYSGRGCGIQQLYIIKK